MERAKIDRPRVAIWGTIGLSVACLLFVSCLTDRPLGDRRRGDADGIAAIAWRDRVVPFQMWGTKLFAVQALEGGYDEVHYLESDHFEVTPFARKLRDLLERHEQVDVFLLSHGNRLVELLRLLDLEQAGRIRLVYSTGCGNADQGPAWLELGADAYVGHPRIHSVSPLFAFYFIRRWVRGWRLAEAVEEANREANQRARWFGVAPDGMPTARAFGDRTLWIGGGS